MRRSPVPECLRAALAELGRRGHLSGAPRAKHPVASAVPALFGKITEAFKRDLRAWAERESIPWLEFPKGARKDDVVQPYRERFTAGGGTDGVVLVGVAQEKASTWRATKQANGRAVQFTYGRTTVYVNHYYVYFIDREWGPGFLKVCGYAPYTMKLCLNGHEWAKRQLTQRGVVFEALDNGFLSCADPVALQASCASLSEADIATCFTRWLGRLPLPVTATDHAAGFGYRLSILQLELSRTQVFDDPLRGREFFEEVIRENLDLGRPDRVQLLFERKITRATPGRFTTRVITDGVAPSLHVEYKRCHVKQYFKEGRALRTETTFNDTQDVGVKKGLSNFAYLRTVGQRINTRLLQLEQVAHDCALAAARLADAGCAPWWSYSWPTAPRPTVRGRWGTTSAGWRARASSAGSRASSATRSHPTAGAAPSS